MAAQLGESLPGGGIIGESKRESSTLTVIHKHGSGSSWFLPLLPSQRVEFFQLHFSVLLVHTVSQPATIFSSFHAFVLLASGKCLHFSGSGNAYCFRPFIHFPFAFFAHLPRLPLLLLLLANIYYKASLAIPVLLSLG